VYVHRFIRLGVLYYFFIFFILFLYPYCGKGPAWGFSSQELHRLCDNNWWWNILYINNFYPNGMETCADWSWYIANGEFIEGVCCFYSFLDMQFFLIAPLIIAIYLYSKILGWIITSTLVLLSVVLRGIFSCLESCFFLKVFSGYYAWEWEIGIGMYENDVGSSEYWHYYALPGFRFAPYGIGILTAMYLRRGNTLRKKISIFFRYPLYFIVATLMLALMYSPYDVTRYFPGFSFLPSFSHVFVNRPNENRYLASNSSFSF